MRKIGTGGEMRNEESVREGGGGGGVDSGRGGRDGERRGERFLVFCYFLRRWFIGTE